MPVLLEEAHPAATAAQEEESRRLLTAMPISVPPPEAQGWTFAEFMAWQAKQPQPTREQWEEVSRVMQGEVSSVPYAKAKVAYKALLFFVRAYQDALYRTFLESRGERAGRKSTITQALSPGKPLAKLFADELPGYADWFWRWWQKRNRVKDGASIGFTGVGGFGLLFMSITDEGGVEGNLAQTPFSLRDVTEAVAMSAHAAECIAAYVEELTSGRARVA
jgi:hypothetical protein